MAIADQIPLMESGATGRNALVLAGYFILLPLVIIAIPFFLAYAVGTNRHGLGDKVANSPLAAIPGIKNGGWSAAVVVFAIVIVVFGVIGAATPSTDDPGDNDNLEGNVNPDSGGGDGSGNGDGGTESGNGDTDTSDSDSGNGDTGDSGDSSSDENGDSDESSGDGGGDSDGSSSDGNGDSDENSGNGNGDSDGSGESNGDNSSDGGTDEPQLTTLESIRDVDDRYDTGTDTFSGSDDAVTDTFSPGIGAVTYIYEHEGDANFIVEVIDAETDETVDIIINEVGTTDGVRAIPMEAGDYYLDVQVDGDWSIEVAQPLPMEEDLYQAPVNASGEGNDVVGAIDMNGRYTISGEHDGEENFIVTLLPEMASSRYEQAVAFNEIGTYEGETTVQAEGVIWVVVQADGEWTLEIE